MHKKHFLVCAKEWNTILYAKETLRYLGKRKKCCFLCTRNTLLSRQKKEILFFVHRNHFVVCVNERNTIFQTQETLCCLCKRKKHCFLCTRNTLLSMQCKWKNHCFLCTRNTFLSVQMKETLFSVHRKETLFSVDEKYFFFFFFHREQSISFPWTEKKATATFTVYCIRNKNLWCHLKWVVFLHNGGWTR